LASGAPKPDPEELVSMVVRVKYGPRPQAGVPAVHAAASVYENWELIFRDGRPESARRELVGTVRRLAV
jgi:hypothetical protein